MLYFKFFLFYSLVSISLGSLVNRGRVKRGDLEGIVISGGNGANTAVEIYIPANGPFPSFQCQMFEMPAGRFRHTMEGMQACGGGYDEEQRSCIAWEDGQWTKTHIIERPRYEASSFNSDDGVVLMGSSDYPGSIFAVILETPVPGDDQPDSRRPWDLKYGNRGGCSIAEPDTNTVVIVGSQDGHVTRYGQNGFLADLPTLNEDRIQNACGSYYLDDGTKVMMTAGGLGAGNIILDSVEIRMGDGQSPWVFTTPLPSAVESPRIATLNNVIYSTGGKQPQDGYRQEINRWDDEKEEWSLVDNMIRGRNSHAVSTVVIDDSILNYCFSK